MPGPLAVPASLIPFCLRLCFPLSQKVLWQLLPLLATEQEKLGAGRGVRAETGPSQVRSLQLSLSTV